MILADFLKRFPDERACLLEMLKERECCGNLFLLRKRHAYLCDKCIKQRSLLKGTIIEGSRANIWVWFYAMYRLCYAKSGLSAKQLRRETGASYKACWNILHKIRGAMNEEMILEGNVEVDETFIGGKRKMRAKYYYEDDPGRKAVLFGMAERGGRIKIFHVPNTGSLTLLKKIEAYIKKGSTIYSDNYAFYKSLVKYGYIHGSVNHKFKFVDGLAHTQNIESVWSGLKRRITGAYYFVSAKYLQSYVYEAEWKWNHRDEPFLPLLAKVIADPVDLPKVE